MRETLIVIRSECEGSAAIMRGTLNVILNEREGSVPVVRKAVICHPSHRFFTLFHHSISRFSHKAFFPLFRMTGVDKTLS